MYKYSDSEIQEAVKNSYSYAETAYLLGTGKSGSTIQHLKMRIQRLGLDVSHFSRHKTSSEIRRKSSEEILVLRQDGKREKRTILLRVLNESGLKYECSKCGLKDLWQDKVINLEIDHINGNSLDNRLQNLRFLCPNCHSQTESNKRSKAYNPYSQSQKTIEALDKHKEKTKLKNYVKCDLCDGLKFITSSICKICASNKLNKKPTGRRKIFVPPRELAKEVANSSFLATGKKYGVSDNAIRKYLFKNGITVEDIKLLRKNHNVV
jgi:5-methylcytosine-specific restriction endonuclease McrA